MGGAGASVEGDVMTVEQFNALIQKGIDHLDYMTELVKRMDEICKNHKDGGDTP